MWKLDRLARNIRHLLELLDDFKTGGIKFRSLRDGIAADPGALERNLASCVGRRSRCQFRN